MSKRASPVVIGSFVLAGIALALAMIVVFGGGRLFRHTTRLITFFDGSVSGLRVGAPVKFRGIEIGSVQSLRVNLSGAIREPEDTRIAVILEIDEDRLRAEGMTGFDLRDRAQVRALVDRGLRAELATESFVTGLRYVALDAKPNTPARLVSDRSLPYPEIPSIRGAMEQAPEKLDQLLSNLAQIDVASIARSIQDAAADARQLIGSPHLARAVEGLDELTKNLNATVLELKKTASRLDPVTSEFKQTATSARRLVAPEGTLWRQVGATLKELEAAARSLRRLADHINRDPGSLLRGGAQ